MLSILTNFGCHFSCPYCVYRENKINIPATSSSTFEWKQLEKEFAKREGEIVSISGGGDPMYRFEDNFVFWDKLFRLAEEYNIELELHTSIQDSSLPYKNFARVVFHCVMPTQINTIINSVYTTGEPHNGPILRVVFVVQEHFTAHTINEVVKLREENDIDELSFRQMIGADGEARFTLHEHLKRGHMDKWWYIEQDDYNDYFVKDHIESKYLEIGR